MDIIVVNATLLKNHHRKAQKWLVTHKIYMNKAKTKYMCGSGRPTVPNFDAQP